MFAIDLQTATPSQFNAVFRKEFPAADAVVQKCVTFFLYAAGDAGLKISARVLKGRKPRSLMPRKRPLARQARIVDVEAGSIQPQPVSKSDGKKPSEILLMHLDPNEMDDEQQNAVWTMLKYFKAKGL
jgi:hypothetical protein